MTPRDEMRSALKQAVDLELRPLGWTGSLPHFRHRSRDQIRLITFQFYSSGGSFAVEIAECGPDGHTDSYLGKHWPPNKVNAHCIGLGSRQRLGDPNGFPGSDHWYVFGPSDYEVDADRIRSKDHYARVAGEVIASVRQQAEPWWRDQLDARSRRSSNSNNG